MTETAIEEELDIRTGAIKLHKPEDFDSMRQAGRLAASCLDMLTEHVKPGVTTQALDDLAREFMLDHGGVPATVGYKGYRHSSCISLNHVICHGIPGPKSLRNGDILNIDVTVILDGWHGDTSRMFFVGKPGVQAERLAGVAYDAMWRGIREMAPGKHLGDIGAAIQEYVEENRFSVVREYCGHGIGRVFHEDPQVLHYGRRGDGLELEPGMTMTVEPMVNAGKRHVRLLPDGWTVVTKDHKLSAQWEHTVLVTEDGFEVLTLGAADRERDSA